MKKLMLIALTALVAFSAEAQRRSGRRSTKAADSEVTTGKAAKIIVEQGPQLGQTACLRAPVIAGASNVGQCYKKPRSWIVLEAKYATFGTDNSKFQDQLTFTWHVLLETKSATENKGNREGLAPYSYFTTAVTYFNIPVGSHASSVVLPPSYLERYGEPKAVGFVITNANGEELGGDCWSEIKGIPAGKKFWDNSDIMDAKFKDGKPMIERRQGLVDRSKTIWALVNPNDYEATLQ
jgi:hypothetical protein